MAGISSQAAGKMEDRYKFNGGNELQSGEFSDGTSLNWYDAEHRMYDPQIGRFLQIDKMGELSIGFSPYAFASNNPISKNDPLGLATYDVNKLPSAAPNVTVSTPAKNSITYALNHGSLEDATGWVHTMISYGHTPFEIQRWADNNALLNDRAWRLISIAVKPASLAYDAQMKKYWEGDGELFKFFLISITAEFGGELLGGLGEGAEALEETEALGNEGVVTEQSGVYDITTKTGERYIGQSQNMFRRILQHFAKSGKLNKFFLDKVVGNAMEGSTQLEREVYEQYMINTAKSEGAKLLNIVNPMGGRMDVYENMIQQVIQKFGLPK